MITRRRRLPLIVVAGSIALAAPLLLSGCSLIHLPGSSSTGGGISIPGIGSVGTGKLPNGFPSEIPVAKGDILSGISAGSGADQGWNVSIKVSGLDAFTGIESQLKGAGFTESDGSPITSDQASTGTFTSSSYDVVVAVVKADDKTGYLANYTVAKHKNN
ncbi:MAG: hypothetical protein M3N46_08020 [Actinomycetota bacterium]|nr:hypothetical protein [Actinomycetota bacterium]